jgi:hypothetical protein
MGSIKILKKYEDNKDQEREKDMKEMVKADPHTQPYIEDIHYVDFDDGSLSFMWDKREGKPKYDKMSEVLWLGPYIIKKKFEKGAYYLYTMDGRKIPLSVDGSIL